MRGGSCRVHEGGVALHLLEHLLVFLARLDRRDAERDDLETAEVAPLGGQDVIEGVGHLHGVAGERRIADALLGDLGKGGLQGGQQLGLELTVEPVTGEAVGDVAADVGVEEDRVADAVAVFAEAADGDVDINARALVDDAERHRRRRTVFVADELLGIEVVDALVLGRLTAEGEALADVFEGGEDVLAQLAAEQRRLRRGIVFEFAGLRAELGDLALIDDDHALAVGDRDDGAVGDDVVRALRVAAAAGGPLLAADSHDAFRKRITIEILKPLIGHHAARGAQSCFDKSHLFTLLY